LPSDDSVSAQQKAAVVSNPPEATPVVAFRRLSFGYGERQIIDAVSFEIRAGQVVALMGGSGVGKTTLLRLISGLVAPQQGVVEVFGGPLDNTHQTRLYEARRRMGLLFQFGALFTDLTCFENVAFPIREHTNLPNQ